MDKYAAFLVLESIARGYSEKGKILRRLDSIDREIIENTLRELEEFGLIKKS